MGLTEWLLNFGVTLINKIGYLGMVLALALDSCGIPIPSEAVLALSGASARTGKFNIVVVVILGAIAQTAGAYIAYLIGAAGGEPLIKRYGKYLLISAHDYEKAERWFAKRGEKAIFISRLIPVIRTFAGFVAGTFKMNIWHFLRDSFAGSLVWGVVFAGLGYAVGDSWRHYTNFLHYIDYIVLVIVVVLIIRYIYRKMKQQSHARS